MQQKKRRLFRICTSIILLHLASTVLYSPSVLNTPGEKGPPPPPTPPPLQFSFIMTLQLQCQIYVSISGLVSVEGKSCSLIILEFLSRTADASWTEKLVPFVRSFVYREG